MKTLSVTLVTLLTLAAGCATPTIDPHRYAGTTRLTIDGPPDAPVSGSYTQDGRRIPFTGPLPWHLDAPRISSIDLRKSNRSVTLTLDLRYDSDVAHSTMHETLGPDIRSFHLQVADGLVVTKSSS